MQNISALLLWECSSVSAQYGGDYDQSVYTDLEIRDIRSIIHHATDHSNADRHLDAEFLPTFAAITRFLGDTRFRTIYIFLYDSKEEWCESKEILVRSRICRALRGNKRILSLHLLACKKEQKESGGSYRSLQEENWRISTKRGFQSDQIDVDHIFVFPFVFHAIDVGQRDR